MKGTTEMGFGGRRKPITKIYKTSQEICLGKSNLRSVVWQVMLTCDEKGRAEEGRGKGKEEGRPEIR